MDATVLLKSGSVTDTFLENLRSFAELQFYRALLTTRQLLLISGNIFDVPLSLSAIYHFSH